MSRPPRLARRLRARLAAARRGRRSGGLERGRPAVRRVRADRGAAAGGGPDGGAGRSDRVCAARHLALARRERDDGDERAERRCRRAAWSCSRTSSCGRAGRRCRSRSWGDPARPARPGVAGRQRQRLRRAAADGVRRADPPRRVGVCPVQHHYEVDPSRDLAAMGASNLLAGFSSGFVQSGGASQTPRPRTRAGALRQVGEERACSTPSRPHGARRSSAPHPQDRSHSICSIRSTSTSRASTSGRPEGTTQVNVHPQVANILSPARRSTISSAD